MRPLALLLLLQTLPGAAQAPVDVDRLAWMSGCWVAAQGGMVIEEAWLGPRAGLMMGVSRTVRDGVVVGTERLEITSDSAGVVYRAWPSGQAPASFRAVSVTEFEAVFEDPAHDFPQRIAYRRVAEGIDARVESLDGANGFDIPYRRGCGSLNP